MLTGSLLTSVWGSAHLDGVAGRGYTFDTIREYETVTLIAVALGLSRARSWRRA